MSRIVQPSDLLKALGAETAPIGAETHVPLAVAPDGRRITLPVKLVLRPRRRLRRQLLIITFSGSVDQSVRGFPHYPTGFASAALIDDAVVLAIADPSLWLSPELRTGWYAANQYADVPRAIGDLVAAVVSRLAPRRLIFVGNSNGAHGALVQSARFPGCVCLALSPITRISGFYPHRIQHYLSVCWDGARSLEALPAEFVDDCGLLYREGHAHSLILLQNATDPHLLRQAVPFAAQVRDRERMLFLTHFYPDMLGHALPGKLRLEWVTAAALAPTADCLDIARTHAEMFAADQSGPAPERRAAEGRAAAPRASDRGARDLDLAARLAAASLQK